MYSCPNMATPRSHRNVVSNDADHSRIRHLLSHAFSESALREQEPLITSYVDLLIVKLREQIEASAQGKVDIVRWFNFATFDIVGDLVFGESFQALEKGQYHVWVANIFKIIKGVRLFRVFRAYPVVREVAFSLRGLFPSLTKARIEHAQFTRDKTIKRLDRETDRRDIMRNGISF